MYAWTIRALFVFVVGAALARPASTYAQMSCVDLQSGVAKTGLTAPKGTQQCFRISVPDLQTRLSVTVSGSSGNADLYVRYGAVPTTRVYDCRSTAKGSTDRCDMSAPAGGTWYVSLNAQTAFSGATLQATFQDTFIALQNGVAQEASGTQGTQSFFQIALPSGRRSLSVTLRGGTGNADLYVRPGAWPTLKIYACRSAARTNNETCTINSPAAGTWYVMVNASTSFSGASLTVTYDRGLMLVSGGGQVGAVNTALAEPIVVRVEDPQGQPAPGHTVHFDVTAGGGVITASTVATMADGTAAVGWTLGPTRVPQEVTVSAVDPGTNAAVTLKATASASGQLVVNSLEDPATPPRGALTLRLALATASSGETISFAAGLAGKTIELVTVGDEHSVLVGEVYSGMTYLGYQERDYGRSALYARKNVVLDASALPGGITLHWNGGATRHARVLAVYGNLTMKNVIVSSGSSFAEPTGNTTQAHTLARGGGLAVWGVATLRQCKIVGNTIDSGAATGRDLAAYGGGIFANGLDLQDCVVSGNRAIGSGAAGGGIYSVGGADKTSGYGNDTYLDRCTVSGNLVQGANAYGGGVFTLSGGPSNLATMRVANSTVARNVVKQTPGSSIFYYRGGGIYMGGGSLELVASTIAENEVFGTVKMDSTDPTKPAEPPNIGGAGVGATIGNAHTVEYVWLQNSIVVGNKLNGEPEDWFVGSLIEFNSGGYNLVGKINFTQILAPIPAWMDLSRKHWPKVGDIGGVQLGDVLGAPTVDPSIASANTDAGDPAVLWYPPLALAIDKIPVTPYQVTNVYGGYSGYGTSSDDFLNRVVQEVQQLHPGILPSEFASQDRTGITWYGPARTWPSEPQNQPWISFWRALDKNIGDQLGMQILADEFWGTLQSGSLDASRSLSINRTAQTYTPEPWDQMGNPRPSGTLIDIGAIEQ